MDAATAFPIPPLGRREAGKEERRQRIIAAARTLIRETGSTGLSMRELARCAGVSLATPYNLFGSKAAVVLAVLQDVRDFRDRFSRFRDRDPIDRIFAAVDLAIEFYLADPRFYRTLWQAVFGNASDVRAAIYNPKRDAFWRTLIDGAVEAGAIDPAIDPALLLNQLDHQFRAVMLAWVVGELPPPALAPAVRLGHALILRGAATDPWREPLAARLHTDQHALRAAGVPLGAGLGVMPA